MCNPLLPCSAERGFTLIEIMIAIAIVGILAVIAIPNYVSYIHKTKFSEVIQATAPFKLAVEMCAHEQGSLNNCGSAGKNGIPPNFTAVNAITGYVHEIVVGDKGMITATSQQINVDGNTTFTYILTPTYQANGQVTWEKGGSCVAQGWC